MAAIEAFRRNRKALSGGKPRPQLSREELKTLLAHHRELFANIIAPTPVDLPECCWADSDVIIRDELAIIRCAAQVGINIDLVPLNVRICPPHDGGAA